MGSTPSAPSKAKPSPPDEIVELRAPAESGSTMTHKVYRHAKPPFDLQFFLSKGYTVVDPKDAA